MAKSSAAQHAEQLMLGAVPGEPALGRGPAPDGSWSRHDYHHPAAGWGAARSVARVLERAGEPGEGLRALFVMNDEDGGFDCPGCAWPDDPDGLKLDICENGVKHVTWELQEASADAAFFTEHTVGELASWNDYDLEAVGRLAEPLSYDAASDRYLALEWTRTTTGRDARKAPQPRTRAQHASGSVQIVQIVQIARSANASDVSGAPGVATVLPRLPGWQADRVAGLASTSL